MSEHTIRTETQWVVVYFYPSPVMATTKRILWPRLPDPAAVPFGDAAFAFYIEEREDVIVNNIRIQGKWRQLGPTYYHPDSKVETLDEVKMNPRANPMMVENMEIGNIESVLWNRHRNYAHPYDPSTCKILTRT